MPVRRSAAARSLVWLRDSLTPMFVVNAQRRVALFNRGCEVLTGWEAGDVLGKRVEATTVAEPDSQAALLAALMPPAEVWQGNAQQVDVWWPQRGQEPTSRVVQFWPIRSPESAIQVVLGIIGAPLVTSAPVATPSVAQTWHRELAGLRIDLRRRFGEKSLIGRCPAMLRVIEQVRLARQSSTPVLIIGEPGSGKDHVARTIHFASPYGRRAFVPLDGRLTPGTELKRVLRHLGDDSTRGGGSAVELQPGSLCLAHVGDVAGDVQERLLEILKTSAAEPAVRVLASCETRLEAAMAADKFSAELWQRLSPLVIELPPLRERGDDVELLAQFFLEDRNRGHDRQVSGFDGDVATQLRRYRWPGNLDELQKVLQEAAEACGEGILRAEHLPFRFRAGMDAQSLGPPRRRVRPLDALLEQVEREELERAVAAAGGNMTQAAELLQIPRARLYRRLEQLGLRQPEAPAERLETETKPGEA